MKAILKLGLLAMLAFGADAAMAGNYKGQSCKKSDTDALKCMVCAIHFEARLNSYSGMVAVGRTIMQRVKDKRYPNSVCKVVYQPHQFVGVNYKGGKPRVLSSPNNVMNQVVKAAKEAQRLGGNGFLGFRTCSYSSKGTNIGGNCFRKTGDIEELLENLAPGLVPELSIDVADAHSLNSDTESAATVEAVMRTATLPEPIFVQEATATN